MLGSKQYLEIVKYVKFSYVFVFGAIVFQCSKHIITHLTEHTDYFTDHQDQFKIPVGQNQRHAYKPTKFKSNRI